MARRVDPRSREGVRHVVVGPSHIAERLVTWGLWGAGFLLAAALLWEYWVWLVLAAVLWAPIGYVLCAIAGMLAGWAVNGLRRGRDVRVVDGGSEV